jgi:AcrR family transcriptional regulator
VTTPDEARSKHRPESVRTQGLTRATILDTYIGLADREGPEAVSLRRLGAEMGVDATAIYRHFRDKAELLAAAADRLLSRLADEVERRDDWRIGVTELALAGRAMYLAHPRLAHVIASSDEPLPGNSRLFEYLLGYLRAAGLGPREAAMACEALAGYIAGTSSLDAETGEDTNVAWRRAFAALPADAFPNAVAVSSYLYRGANDSFRFGLDLLLDAIALRGEEGSARRS